MATSQYNYHPYHTIGAATALLWDAAAGSGTGAWRSLGKVADAAVIMSTEQASKDMTIKGLTQPIARRNRVKRYNLTFRLLENADPQAHALLFGEGSAQSSSAAEVVKFLETVRLYGGQWRELSHPYGIIADVLPGTTEGGVSTSGTGGSITPGTYHYWVLPVYLENDDVAAYGETSYLGQASVATGQVLGIDLTIEPDLKVLQFNIYFSTTENLATAQLAGILTDTTGTLSSHAASSSYSESSATLLHVTSADGGTVFTPGTDYLADLPKGLIKRIASGAIADGQEVLVEYAYARPASIATSLGDPVDLERYRRVRLLQLAADDPDPDKWRETGVEFTFFKVNTNIGDTRWPFSENDFSEGCSVTWDCLFDSTEAKVGTVRGTFGVLAEYA